MVTASLNNYRQSPRKVRAVAALIKGKAVSQALDILAVTVKRASDPIAKLLNSAVANAKDRGIALEGLYVKECSVNQGVTLRRWMPGARGSAFPLKKRSSHVKLVLDTKAPKAKKAAAKATKTAKAETANATK